jgi:hypothetical protein
VFSLTPATATSRLTALAAVPKADLLFLREHGAQVTSAAAAARASGGTGGGSALAARWSSLPFILVMAGRWSPRKACEDAEEHEQMLQRELAALQNP